MQKTNKVFKMWPAVAVLVVALWCVSNASAACPSPSLVHVISIDGMGAVVMTTLGDEVFAVKYEENVIHVYGAASMTYKRGLSVSGLGTVGDLAADTTDNYLYASSFLGGTILKIEPANGAVVLQWSAGSKPAGIAINNMKNLIVSLNGESKIKEYTPDGTLVREVSVALHFSLFDVAQLPSGEFLFSSVNWGDSLVVVNPDGAVVRTDGGLLHTGHGFDIFENGYVIAVDNHNNAVLIMNPSLTSAQQLQVPGLEMLDSPLSVRIDESRGRVYIGEDFSPPFLPDAGWTGGGRLLVLENVTGDCLAF